MMMRTIESFRRFIDCDGRPIYCRLDAFSDNIVVRVHKPEFIKSLRLLEPTHFVAYKPTAHAVIVKAIGKRGMVETFTD